MGLLPLYTEGCNFIRHYSNASLTVRIGTLVQGLVLLSSWGYVYLSDPRNDILLVLVSSYGILFTALLFMLHNGYLRATIEYTNIVIKSEMCKTFIGPVLGYEKKRCEIYRSPVIRSITSHSTFSLLGIAFLLCFVSSIYLLIY